MPERVKGSSSAMQMARPRSPILKRWLPVRKMFSGLMSLQQLQRSGRALPLVRAWPLSGLCPLQRLLCLATEPCQLCPRVPHRAANMTSTSGHCFFAFFFLPEWAGIEASRIHAKPRAKQLRCRWRRSQGPDGSTHWPVADGRASACLPLADPDWAPVAST